MKLGFNEATSMGCSDLETDVRLGAEAGFDYIELRFDKIREYLKTHRVEQIRELLDECGIRPHALNAIYTYAELFGEKDDPARRAGFEKEFLEALRLAKETGAGHIIVVPPMNPAGFTVPYGKSREDSVRDFSRIARGLAKRAEPFGVRLCLEPVGAPKSSIRTVRDALEAVRAAESPLAGLTLDAYNLYMWQMDSCYGEIGQLEKEQIFAVHINNADDTGPSLEARKLCGSGVIDLGAFLGEICKTGYDGMVSVEVFCPEYWKMTPQELIPLAYRTTRAELERHGCL